MASAQRIRTILVGSDFSMFHAYWTPYLQMPDREVHCFVWALPGEPPIKEFHGTGKKILQVHGLKELEHVITKGRIQKVLLLVQNQSMAVVQSIIHRIVSVGSAEIEMLPATKIGLGIKPCKPVIAVSALARGLGKTQLSRYMCHTITSKERKVAIIMPILFIERQSEKMKIADSPHYEFKDLAQVEALDSPTNKVIAPLSYDDKWQVKEYLKAGADRVFVTANIRKAIISSEQKADVIIIDSRDCETPVVPTEDSFCVVTHEILNEVRRRSQWPGLLNLNLSKNVVIVHEKDCVKGPRCENMERVLSQNSSVHVFNAVSSYVADTQDQRFAKDQSVMVITPDDNCGRCAQMLIEEGVGNLIEVASPIPRCASPTPTLVQDNVYDLKEIAKQVNSSNVCTVVSCLQRDITGLLHDKQVIYAKPEIEDINNEIYKWLTKFFGVANKPPLGEHFAAQADIIMAMASASGKELYVSNNDSANREAFCRLFLSSHIPPGFRVTTGEIIDASNNKTGQLDVVIVNDHCPRMTVDASGSIIAPIMADNVLSVIEVKTSLTVDQLKKALSQLRPVKALMPSHKTLSSPDGTVIEDPLGGKIITGIFSFNEGSEIAGKMTEILDLYPGVADFIILPDSFGYFAAKTLKTCGIAVREEEIVKGYVKCEARGMALAILFGILNSMAALRRFSGSNCIRYLQGSWGGKVEAANKGLRDFAKAAQPFDAILTGRNVSHMDRMKYYKAKQMFLGVVMDVRDNMQHKVQNKNED